MAALERAPQFRDGMRLVRAAAAAGGVGLVLLGIGMAVDPRQALHSYLTAFAYVTSIELGALVFLMIGHAMHATWVVPLRKLVEAVASGLLAGPLLFLPLVLGAEQLYVWAGEVAHADGVRFLPAKPAYLNVPFFALRAALYFGVWLSLLVALRRWSLASDRDPARARDGGPAYRASAAGLPLLALTVTLAAFDWLMSLEPAWFSSVYGIYCFAGSFVAAIALVTVLAYAAERSGWLGGFLAHSHYHALGRLLLAFTIFWTYIAYFQLFLIYIANRPEEVTFYVRRIRGGWAGFDYVLLFGHFVLPFLVLLLRDIKLRPERLACVAGFILVMHYLDVHWLVMPVLHARGFAPHWLDLGALLFVAGATTALSIVLLRGQPLVPVNDPALAAGVQYRST